MIKRISRIGYWSRTDRLTDQPPLGFQGSGSCQFEGSNGQYIVTLYQHSGKTARVKLNVTQYDGPRSGYKATCYEAQGISCTGDDSERSRLTAVLVVTARP